MIHPDCDMNRWEYCDNAVVLANADYYYTKEQTEKLISDVSGMTPQEVQEQIDWSIKDKADKSEVNEIAEAVRQQGERLLNTYTKTETDNLLTSYLTILQGKSLFANYSAVDGDVLSLNNENITIN
jgi:hypothetical protein